MSSLKQNIKMIVLYVIILWAKKTANKVCSNLTYLTYCRNITSYSVGSTVSTYT